MREATNVHHSEICSSTTFPSTRTLRLLTGPPDDGIDHCSDQDRHRSSENRPEYLVFDSCYLGVATEPFVPVMTMRR